MEVALDDMRGDVNTTGAVVREMRDDVRTLLTEKPNQALEAGAYF
jgi:hypothetical protein